MTFYLSKIHEQAIIDHALSVAPIEACGIIAGFSYAGSNRDRLIRMNNVAVEWGTNFEFEPSQQVSVWQDIEWRDEVVVAIYHSHTRHPAVPSQRDIAGADAVDPFTRHIIVSVVDPEDPEIAVFQIKDGVATELDYDEYRESP